MATNLWVLYDSDATYGTCKAVSDDAGTITLTVDAVSVGAVSMTSLATSADVTFVLGSTEAFTLTCSDISAPMVMTNTMTTAGKTGCRALFNVKANVALGSYCNAVKGYMEFTGTSGATTGIASGVCAELKTPNRTLPSGAYYPLEVEYVAGGTSVTSNGSGSRVGFLYMQNTVDLNGDFDANGYALTFAGLTAGAGKMLSAQSITLRGQVGLAGSESTRYFVMSSAENNLTLATTSGTSIAIGACTTGIALTGACTTGISIANTSLADAILISGTTPTDGIHISSACGSHAINISGAQTGAGITLASTCGTYGLNIAGACTTAAINIAAPTTVGILMAGNSAYNPIQVGTKSNTTTGGLTLAGATDDTGGIMVFADDGGASLGSVTSPIWTRYLITTAQGASGPTATGMFAQLKTQGSITCTTGGYTALKAYNQAGTVTLVTGAEYGVINAGVTLEGNLVNTSGRFSGVDVNINTSAYTITDTATDSAGIHIRKTSGSTYGWPVGLKINDAGAITGIAIGTCTTGITIAACTTAISAVNPINVAMTQVTATTGTVRAIYGKQTSYSSMTSGNLVGVRGEVTVGGSVSSGVYLYGAQGKLIGGANTITAGSGQVCGVLGQIDVSGTTLASGWIAAIHADIYGANSGGFAMNLISGTHEGGGVINALLLLYGKSDYVFDIRSNTHNNVSTTGTPGAVTGGTGWIKVLVDGAVRYIALADSVS